LVAERRGHVDVGAWVRGCVGACSGTCAPVPQIMRVKKKRSTNDVCAICAVNDVRREGRNSNTPRASEPYTAICEFVAAHLVHHGVLDVAILPPQVQKRRRELLHKEQKVVRRATPAHTLPGE